MADVHSIPTHRTCTKCGETKLMEFFGNATKGRYGKKSQCKDCERIYLEANRAKINERVLKKYHEKQAPKKEEKELERQRRIDARQKACAKCGLAKDKAEFKKHKGAIDGLHCHCRECCNEINREHRKNNPEMAAAWSKKWAQNNKKKMDARRKRFLDKNPGYDAMRQKEWRIRNPETALMVSRRANRKRRLQSSYRLHCAIANRLRDSMKHGKKKSRTFHLLGYTLGELMEHLEKQFLKGMSWDNFGAWHVDHICPVVSFTILDENDPELKACWALTNLRPLWAKDNLQKSAKRTHLI